MGSPGLDFIVTISRTWAFVEASEMVTKKSVLKRTSLPVEHVFYVSRNLTLGEKVNVKFLKT